MSPEIELQMLLINNIELRTYQEQLNKETTEIVSSVERFPEGDVDITDKVRYNAIVNNWYLLVEE